MLNRSDVKALAALAAALCLALPCCFEAVVGGDLWWHLAAGRLIVEGGGLPPGDVFSYTASGRPWLNHEWLAQVGLWGLWRGLGPEGLAWAKVALLLMVFGLTFRRSLGLGAGPAAALLATVAAACVAKPFLDVRPGLLSLLGAALLLLLWEAKNRRLLLLSPLLLLLWANLHAGVLFGLGLVSLLAAEALLDPPRRPSWLTPRLVAALWLVSLLLPLANPNGLALYLFPFSYAPGSAWRALNDWLPARPGAFPVSPLFWPYLALLLVALPLAWRRGWRALTLASLATALMALLSMRFIPLAAVVSAPLLALGASALHGRLGARIPQALRRAGGWMGAAALALLCAAILHATPWRGPLLATMTRLETFPAGAVEFMEAGGVAGRPFHPFGWGGYLMLTLPGQRVFIDQRANTLYGEAELADYLRVAQLEPGWQEVLERWGCDLVLWRSRDLLPALLAQSGGWVVLWRDGVATLLARRESPLLARLAGAPGAPPRLPGSPYALYAQGMGLAAAGHVMEAQQALAAAAPQVLAARNELGGLKARLGATGEARGWLASSLASYPWQMGLRLRLARLAEAEGRPWEARYHRLLELALFPYNPALRGTGQAPPS